MLVVEVAVARRYGSARTLDVDGAVAPLAAPSALVRVTDLLP